MRSQQNPNDAWIHQEIIVDVKPDFIIETGTLNGGSAALWATILQQVNRNGRIITIDIKDEAREAKKLPSVKQYVDFIIGSSTDSAIVSEVKKRVEGKRFWSFSIPITVGIRYWLKWKPTVLSCRQEVI